MNFPVHGDTRPSGGLGLLKLVCPKFVKVMRCTYLKNRAEKMTEEK